MIAGRATAWAIRVIAEYRVEAALALLAHRVEHRDPGAASLLCVRSEAVSASRASALLRAGIVWLRRSAVLLVASSSMIRTSIQGSFIDVVGECLRVCETSQQRAVISMLDPSG